MFKKVLQFLELELACFLFHPLHLDFGKSKGKHITYHIHVDCKGSTEDIRKLKFTESKLVRKKD